MLMQNFWRKRILVIGAMVFLLTLCALNLNALVRGKVEVNQAQALRLLFIGLHHKDTCWEDFNGNGQKDPGEEYECCKGTGLNCISLYLPW